MAISELQNFYKEQIAVATGAGVGNIYVSTKPTPTNGFLVISPGSESLREVIKYTGTGTDGDGDYVAVADVADRGLGGTTAQTHEVGEPIRMNYTAEHQKEIDDTIESIVAGGTPDASTTVKGRSKLSVAPVDAADPIAVGDNDPRMNATDGLTEDQEDALAGGGDFGTPSASNKFVTEDYLSQAVSTTYNLADSPATFTKKDGLRFVRVQIWGGGGSGGASSAENSSGGGGGSYLEGFFDASQLGATETITIGAGGAAISGTANGNNGGNTSFGSLLVAYGGKGGLQGNTNIAGGNGGHVGSTSITSQYGIAVSGQAGADGKLWGGAAGGGIDESGAGGLVGGSSVFGGAGGGGTENLSGGAAAGGTSVFGGNGGAAAQSTNATAGSVPGGGGGGAHAGNSGAGGAGRCIVTEYYS